MKNILARGVAFLIVFVFVCSPVWATCGGGGGGRPNFAQAGGKDSAKLSEAMQLVREKLIDISIKLS